MSMPRTPSSVRSSSRAWQAAVGASATKDSRFFTMAGIIFKKNLDDNVNPYILLLTAAAARCMSFPNYNARPHLASLLLTIILLYSMLSDKLTVKKKIIVKD